MTVTLVLSPDNNKLETSNIRTRDLVLVVYHIITVRKTGVII